MSGHEPISAQRDCGADVGAYVLGALEPRETDAFRRHLATCAACRDEVAALRGAADALALSAAQLPAPSGLKLRVMSGIRELRRSERVGTVVRDRQPRRRLRAPALAGALVAAAAVSLALVLASGGASHARLVRASVAAPNASAVLRLFSGGAELVVEGMPQPPTGKIYEVWLRRAGQPPAPTNALFGVTAAGSAAVAVPGRLGDVKEILVTPERFGGSLAPTHAPVIVARLG
jgi:hypothetical protein